MERVMMQMVIDRTIVAGHRWPMTYEAWRAWEVEGLKSEWVDGEVIVFMPATIRHGDVMVFLAALLTAYNRFRDLGVVAGSVAMRVGGRGRAPDIFFVRADQRDRVSEYGMDGPADLVVEIVCEDSVDRDYHEKFKEYADAGVPEYWTVDTRLDMRGARFFHLVAGTYQPIPMDADGRVWSMVVEGFWVRPEWFVQDPLPSVLDCMREIAPEILAAKIRQALTASANAGAAGTAG
jgi:Uma2 family endonuclease